MAMEPIGDQLSIETPELVDIEMPLAGIGSRFVATLVDSLVLASASLLLIFLAAYILPALSVYGEKAVSWGVGIVILIFFLLFWGYFALFEAFNSGRTLGKHVARIRVIHQSGRGVNFVESLARNLLRYVDFLPFFYAVGIVIVFLNRQHQRLGDMVAGTLVVREREIDAPAWNQNPTRIFAVAAPPAPPASSAAFGPATSTEVAGWWDGAPHLRLTLPAPVLGKLAPSDLAVLESFLARRLDMDLAARSTLAARVAAALCAKSGLTIPPDASVETFLEAVAHQFRELGRMS